jgi:tRNA A37 threonylcarbamoyltransferase TsaD
LPEVAGGVQAMLNLQDHEEKVMSLLHRADALTAQAAVMAAQATALRSDAYREIVRLECEARQYWSYDQINAAKRKSFENAPIFR